MPFCGETFCINKFEALSYAKRDEPWSYYIPWKNAQNVGWSFHLRSASIHRYAEYPHMVCSKCNNEMS